MCSGRTAGSGPANRASSAGSYPSSAASGIPCTLPEGEVAGELMSACASTQMRPTGWPWPFSQAALAATDPAPSEWSPPSTIGKAPSWSDASEA